MQAARCPPLDDEDSEEQSGGNRGQNRLPRKLEPPARAFFFPSVEGNALASG